MDNVPRNPFIYPINAVPPYHKGMNQHHTTCAWADCDSPSCLLFSFPVCLAHAYTIFDRMVEFEPMDAVTWRVKEIVGRKIDRKRKARAKGHPGWVYYLQVGDRIKIGFATDVRRRMRQYPPNSDLLATRPGDKKLERELHQHFAAFRTEGREWFSTHPELMVHIDEVRIKYKKERGYSYRKANSFGGVPRPQQQWSSIG